MGKDIVQYSFRLNLDDPLQLEVHQKLHDLNTDIHRSKNAFIVQGMIQHIHRFEEDELTNKAAEERENGKGFISRRDMKEIEKRIMNHVMERVMKEVISILGSSLAGKRSYPVVQTKNAKGLVEEQEDTLDDDFDETIEKLALDWS